MLLCDITFFTLHYFNREVLIVFGILQLQNILFICQDWQPAKRNFQKRFHNHKNLIEIRRDGHGTILPEYARDNFKENTTFKWYIVKMGLIYSIIARKCMFNFHEKFEIRVVKLTTPHILRLNQTLLVNKSLQVLSRKT